MFKMGESGGFLARLLGPLLKTGLPLTKNGLKTLDKSILTPLGLTAAALATDAAIPKKIFESGITALIISKEEMDDIMKIMKSLEGSGLLIKGINRKIKNEAKEQKSGSLSILLGTLGASLTGNLLTGKGVIRPGERAIATSQRLGAIRAGQGFKITSSFN